MLALLYLMVFGSLIAFNCYSFLVALFAAQKITTYALVNPVIALALGALVLDEKITPAASPPRAGAARRRTGAVSARSLPPAPARPVDGRAA